MPLAPEPGAAQYLLSPHVAHMAMQASLQGQPLLPSVRASARQQNKRGKGKAHKGWKAGGSSQSVGSNFQDPQAHGGQLFPQAHIIQCPTGLVCGGAPGGSGAAQAGPPHHMLPTTWFVKLQWV